MAAKTEVPVFTATPYEVPSKWDIIPIHTSDRGAFKACRRRWNWSSPSRHNLVLRADIHGVNVPMWYGTGIHYALEQMYDPSFKRDPVEAFTTWFDIQWRGGLVTDDWLNLIYDLKPQKTDDSNLWKVRGLEDIIPSPNVEEFEQLRELGIGMLTYYKEYAEEHDDFKVVCSEHDFSVPILGEDGEILKAIDIRENSPNYGKELEVHYRGRMDKIIHKPATGRFGIWDYKTTAALSDDPFKKLETDEQMTSYLWAARIEGQYYENVPWKEIDVVVYEELRKAFPRDPTELTTGWFSINRADESTTHDRVLKFMQQRGFTMEMLNEKQKAYLDYLQEVGSGQFIVRTPVRRNQHELWSAGERIRMEALDMLDPNIRIYPNMREYQCNGCFFRLPCLAQEAGADYEEIVTDNYTSNKDR